MTTKSLATSFLMALLVFSAPIMLFAQEEATEGSEEEKQTQQETFKDKANEVVQAIPEPVRNKTSEVTNKIETWRLQQAEGFNIKKIEAKERFEALKSDEAVDDAAKESIEEGKASSGFEQLFAYVKFSFFWLIHAIFNIKWLFYALAVFLVVSILRSVFRQIRRRNGYYD